jgi:hypothetical protein
MCHPAGNARTGTPPWRSSFQALPGILYGRAEMPGIGPVVVAGILRVSAGLASRGGRRGQLLRYLSRHVHGTVRA